MPGCVHALPNLSSMHREVTCVEPGYRNIPECITIGNVGGENTQLLAVTLINFYAFLLNFHSTLTFIHQHPQQPPSITFFSSHWLTGCRLHFLEEEKRQGCFLFHVWFYWMKITGWLPRRPQMVTSSSSRLLFWLPNEGQPILGSLHSRAKLPSTQVRSWRSWYWERCHCCFGCHCLTGCGCGQQEVIHVICC
jgi:hypothetical protein